MSNAPTVSALVLARNDGHRIGRCLAHLQGWVNETVVVDDCSTDDTQAVCTAYGAKVIVRSSEGDFGSQRNFGIDAVKSEWVLCVDSDEIVTNDLRREIQEALTAGTVAVAFKLSLLNHVVGKPLWHAEDKPVVRLFRRGSGRFSLGVHEDLELGGQSVRTLRSRIVHYPYPTISSLLLKQDRYTQLEVSRRAASHRFALVWALTARPVRRFLVLYFLRQGFKDGVPGLLWATFGSFYEFLAAAKVYEASESVSC